ncbi:MAG: ferritin-like domain-containing protein [Oligoflexales bacterium]|nr:ferritin-like domain-containing protein [Oligoflexales bacterium]
MINDYDVKDPKIGKLIKKSVDGQWDFLKDLPWNNTVDIENMMNMQGGVSFISDLPEFKKMSENQRQHLILEEGVYHLCNLLIGEYKGIKLASHIMTNCPNMDWVVFMSTVLSDERSHFLALSKYLKEKIGILYAPDPSLTLILDQLCEEKSIEIQLFVSQVVLEWTATSLLSSLALKTKEPLLGELIRRIISDEGRHLAFNGCVLSHLDENRRERIKPRLEDQVYEGIRACLSSLIAVPVWDKYEFSKESCIKLAIRSIEEKGVVQFYRHVIPKQLGIYGLLTDSLLKRIDKDLIPWLIQSNLKSLAAA